MTDKAARALRRFCLDCQGGHLPSVSACADTLCLLYPWRRKVADSGPAAPGGRQDKGAEPVSGPLPGDAPAGGPLPGREDAGAPPPTDLCAASTPIRVIRRFCLACAGSRAETRACDARESCPLWSFRFGVSPATFKRVIARRRKRLSEPTLPGL